MRHFHSLSSIPSDAQGAVAAIGNFDGVHLGHQKIIEQARQAAQEQSRPLAVMTFEPHPRDYFAAVHAKQSPALRLMSAQTRARKLADLGVDILFEVPFDAYLASLSDEAFAQEIIARTCGISHVVVGKDFRFGHGRTGNGDDLARYGQAMGFDVQVAGMFDLAGVQVSSTRIREALGAGRTHDAAAMLGGWHRVVGEVEHGHKRGRTLGYPTANLSLGGLHMPKFGVYAVAVDVLSGDHAGGYDGVASIGVRPMFGENVPNCETFIFDFAGDLYGAQISVSLVEYLRPEQVFDGADALVKQMDRDSKNARTALARL